MEDALVTTTSVFDLSSTGWIIAILCAAMVGFTKSGIAGVGILVVPLMATIFPAGYSTGILLPILVTGDIFAVSYYRKHAIWKYVLRALPWAVVGILTGYAMNKGLSLPNATLKKMIGIIVLLVLAAGEYISRKKASDELSIPQKWWFAATVGIVGGFMTMTANAAGPIWIVYLLALGLSKEAFLGTNGWIFLILNVFKIPFQYDLGNITAESLIFNAKMIPFIGLGAFLGIKTVKIIPQKAFTITVKLLTVAACIKLLFY